MSAAYAADFRDDMLSLAPGRWIVLRVQARLRVVELVRQLEQTRVELETLNTLLEEFPTYDSLRAIGRGEGVS